jgi:hypothetical protein
MTKRIRTLLPTKPQNPIPIFSLIKKINKALMERLLARKDASKNALLLMMISQTLYRK